MKKRQAGNISEVQKGCIGLVIISIILAISLYTCGDSSYETENSPSSQEIQLNSEVSKVYVTRDGFIAAITEEYLDEAYMYARDNDPEALDKLIKMQVAFFLKPDIEVIIVDGDLLGKRKAEFRIKGDRNTFWTVREAFDLMTEEEYRQLKLKQPSN